MREPVFLTIKEICILSMLTIILFLQEEILTFLPNIQFTIMLILLYSKVLGFKRTTLIIIVYLVLDNLVMGSFNPLLIVFQFIGWMLIPILTCTLLKNIQNNIILALFGILFSLLYSWACIIPGMMFTGVKFIPYLIADIPFELLLCGSSFLSILLLYNPLSKVLSSLYENNIRRKI